ncbi:SAM domain-containing protein [Heracleum sosnowskyi]|uniref:SAM domain-containing protein n=1 Tax=Heracleum sosnowskyi TaxID=360622 RepID=A0AAD8JL29_9APIA|nr:SAM domain-containing protein [Heracleum sosnowskyi]
MAKPKQRHQLRTPVNITPSGSAHDIDVEYDWVIVKKQKVTILIPPLPVTKKSATPNPKQNQPQAKLGNTVNVQSPSLIKPNQWKQSDTDGEKSVSTTCEKTIPDSKKPLASHPISPTPGLPKAGTSQPRLRSKFPVQDSGYNRTFGVRSASKLNKKHKSFHDGKLLLHQSLRASNLERKLRRAGGLSRWLTSLGLDQFVTFFRGRRVSKFQLVNLTMEKLKDMGVRAVGPRRKLMHSIDCLCQPHCFEAL